MEAAIGTGVLFGFGFASMGYVYWWRGQARWESLSEYLRKGWPIFTPLNCLLYMFTEKRAAKPRPDISDFPELAPIAENWEVIRDEAAELLEAGYFDAVTDMKNDSYYDLGFRTFYKYGWSKFYLTWYGHTLNSAKTHCPKTVEIVSKIKSVNGTMLTVLPPGGKLTRHLDPVAVSLRYHLGLKTPNSDDCHINVDGSTLSWRDGQAFLFDETYLHFVNNNTDQWRLILMADVRRPMHFIGWLFYIPYRFMIRHTLVPNMPGDQRGLVNRTMATLSPIFARSKDLKKTNRPAYLALKWSVNIALLILLGAVFYGASLVIGKLI